MLRSQGGPDLSMTSWDVWDVKMRGGRIGCFGHVWAPLGVYNTMHTAPSLASNKHTTLPNIAGWDILGMWGCAWRCQAGQWLILACTPFGGPNQRWQPPAWGACTPCPLPCATNWGSGH